MADGISTAHANNILDWFARAVTAAAPADIYVKLHIGDPGAAGANNAATETTRQSPAFADAAASGTIDNSGAVSWTNYPAAETISWISLWDAAAAGNFMGKKALAVNRTPAIGDTVTLAAGDLDLTITVAS